MVQSRSCKWEKFRSRYFDELKANPDAWQPIIDAARHGTVTLIYSSHDTEHNNAVALQEFLQRHLHKKELPANGQRRMTFSSTFSGSSRFADA